jgi:hypothetical protein
MFNYYVYLLTDDAITKTGGKRRKENGTEARQPCQSFPFTNNHHRWRPPCSKKYN